MIRVVLLGYGAMGRELERLAPATGCAVVGIYDEAQPLTDHSSDEYDVAIDFTLPNAIANNVKTVCAQHRNMVIGTTGWYDKMSDLQAMQAAVGNGIVWGSNFSVGVQMFFRLVREASRLANALPQYNVSMHEWHHTRKRDSPSGTAVTTRNIVLDELRRVSAMDIESIREGNVVGKHIVTFTGPHDTIDIVHDASDRGGFAMGALQAARWIHGRTGWYDYTDVFDQMVAIQSGGHTKQ